jgi:hypothetical protein
VGIVLIPFTFSLLILFAPLIIGVNAEAAAAAPTENPVIFKNFLREILFINYLEMDLINSLISPHCEYFVYTSHVRHSLSLQTF